MKSFFHKLFSIVTIFTFFSCAAENAQPPHVDLLTSNTVAQQKQNITKATLSNGMTVLVYKNTTTPKVRVQVAYNIGSNVEQEGERGLAHLIEHMIFKGTKKLSEVDIVAIARKYGAEYNAFTSYDMTSYYFEVDKANWTPFLFILADSMENTRFDEQHLASEIKTVLQELKMRDDSFILKMVEQALALTHPANHPYHHSVIGYRDDLAKLSAKNLKKFYNKYYLPHRATLFVIGDVDPNHVVELAQKTFGHIKDQADAAKDFELAAVFPPIRQETTTQDSHFYEDVKKESHFFYWRVPGLKSSSATAARITCSILNQGNCRLNQRLVDQEKVASSVFAATFWLMESGIFYIMVTPEAGKTERCKQIVQEELLKLAEQGVDSHELQKIVKRQKHGFIKDLACPASFIFNWLQSYFATNDEYDILKESGRVAAITSSDVVQYMRTYLDPFLMNHAGVFPLPEGQKNRWNDEQQKTDQHLKQILSHYVRTEPLGVPEFVKTMPAPNPISLTFPKPHRCITLSNGLLVQLHQNNQWPLISLFCGLKDRCIFSATREGIIVKMMMSMLSEGSTQYNKQEILDFFERYGASCSYSAGGANLSCLSEDFTALTQRCFHVLTQPNFQEDAFNKVKSMCIDEYERMKDDPFYMGFALSNKLLYENHPYGFLPDDALETIKKASLQDLIEKHKHYINPANMILTIVGDFDLDQMEQEVQEIFGAWSGGAYVSHEYPHDLSQYKPQRQDLPMLRDQAILFLARPNQLTKLHEDYLPMQVLSQIYFGGFGSRIFALREQCGLFYTAGGYWAAPGASIKDHCVDQAFALVDPAKLDEVEELIKSKISAVQADGVTQEELDAVKQILINLLINSTVSNQLICGLLNDLAVDQLPYDYHDKELTHLQKLSKEEVNGVCRKYCTTDAMSVVRVGRVDATIA